MKWEDETMKQMSLKEKLFLEKLMTGKANVNTNKAQTFLSKPHVAVTLETILDDQGLSDDRLTYRLKQIVNRKATTSKNAKTGTTSTNINAIDANALQAIVTIWKLKGKFVEKVADVSDQFKSLPDSELNKLIDNSRDYLKTRGISGGSVN